MHMHADMSSKTFLVAGLRATAITALTWMEQLFDASVTTTFR